MIDAHGNPIQLAWSPVEIIWLEASITLPTLKERMDAYKDIAAMTGRTFSAIKAKALRMQYDRDEAELNSRYGVVSLTQPCYPRAPYVSGLRQPTKAQLMAGKAVA